MTFLSARYQKEFNQIVRSIENEAKNAFLQQIIGKPCIPRLALALHFLLLKDQRYTQEQIQAYCTSTTLIQMGLDIHDNVSNEDEKQLNREQNRERQLQVLAGDLYSGQFYRLLAQRGEMGVIHFLTEAICLINEAKTNLYDLRIRDQLTLKRYIQEVEKIGSALLKAWLHRGRVKSSGQWDAIVTHLLTAEKLLHSSDDNIPESWVAQLKHKAHQLIARARLVMQDWSSIEMKRELEHVVNAFFPDVSELGKTAEEC